jgi:hypothetical protein
MEIVKESKISEGELTVKEQANYPSRYKKGEESKTVKADKSYKSRYGK